MKINKGMSVMLGLAASAIGGLALAGTASAANVGTSGELAACLDWNSEETVCTLTDDISLGSTIQVSKAVELNLNGHTIATTGDGYFLVYYADMNITGTGTVNSEAATYAPFYVWGYTDSGASNFSVLTIGESTTVKTGDSGWGIIVPSNSAHAYGVVVNINGTIDAGYGMTINGNVQDVAENAPTFNIGDTAKITTAGHAVYAAGYGVWNVGAATIVGGEGIGLKAGKFNFNGTSVTTTGAYVQPAPWGNGINDSGAVFQIESHDGYADNIEVTINGGRYASTNGNVVLEYKEKENTQNSVKKFDILGGEFVAGGNEEVFDVSDNFALTGFVSGGFYSKEIEEKYIKEGYDLFEAGDDFVVSEMDVVDLPEMTLLVGETRSLATAFENYSSTSVTVDDTGDLSVSGMVLTAVKSGAATYTVTYGNGIYRKTTSEYRASVIDLEKDLTIEADEELGFSAEEISEIQEKVAEMIENGQYTSEDGAVSVVDIEALREAIANGETIRIEKVVEEIDPAGLDEEGLEQLAKIIDENDTPVSILSIEYAMFGGNDQVLGHVNKLVTPVTVEFAVPEGMREAAEGFTRKFTVVRFHSAGVEEQITRLAAEFDGEKASVENDLFSVFILTYQDEENVVTPGTGRFTKEAEDFAKPNSKVGVWVLACGMMMLGYGFVSLGKQYQDALRKR